MTASTLPEIVQGLADALEGVRTAVEGLQVYPYLNPNPTPPSIDIYPADPFQDAEGFSPAKRLFFTVRARASSADTETSGQLVLLQLLEPTGPTSVEEALCWNGLGGLVESVTVAAESPSGYRVYPDPGGGPSLVGVEWRLEVLT
jgi:hypothetical protein